MINTELTVAMLSVVGSIVAAIIAWAQTIKVTRLKASTDAELENIRARSSMEIECIKKEALLELEKYKRDTNIELEELKISSERRRKAYEMAAVEAHPLETALSEAWTKVQLAKDAINEILAAPYYRRHEAVLKAREKIGNDLHHIELSYRDYGSMVPEEIRRAWHDLKYDVYRFESHLDDLEENFNNETDSLSRLRSPEPVKQLEALRTLHITFTRHQAIIVMARENLRLTFSQKLRELI